MDLRIDRNLFNFFNCSIPIAPLISNGLTLYPGRTNLKDNSVLDLEQVAGTITSKIRSEIYLTSDYAKYNYTNQNSKFFENVKIKYDEKVIYCDNLELEINKNIAIAYGNVLVKDKQSQMKAQIILMDIITKDLSINSSNEISITTN